MLSQVCYFVIANAVLASMLAIVVWCLSTWVRRPAVLHLLWVLVLVRLVMPPVLLVNANGARDWLFSSVRNSSETAVTITRESAEGQVELLAIAREMLSRHNLLPARSFSSSSEGSGEQLAAIDADSTLWDSGWQWLADVRQMALTVLPNLALGLLCVWVVGSVAIFIVQMSQITFFRYRLAKISYRSRAWQARAEKVAKRMGLAACPEVLLVRATISPMLWGFGRNTRVLFPERLLVNLRPKEQNTLLAHELAHYRRGDQWVRLLEMVAIIVFWWHPVLWWAIREVEVAEEMCCDAWALKLADGSPRTYAEALLATVDFVSLSLPPAASGASHSQLIAQRVKAIMCERRVGNWFTPDAYPSIWALALLILIPCPFLSRQSTTPAFLPNGVNVVGLATNGSAGEAVSLQPSDDAVVSRATSQFELEVTDAQQAILRNRETQSTIDLGVGVVSAACFSEDGKTLVVGTMQGGVDFWDCRGGRVFRHIDLGSAAIGAVAFSPNQSQLAVGTRDGLCKLIDLNGDREEEVIRRERGSRVDCVRFSPDGRYAAVLWNRRSSQRVELWDLLGRRVATALDGQRDIAGLTHTTDSASGGDWLVLRKDGSVGRWSAIQGYTRLPQQLSPKQLRRLRFSGLSAAEILEQP